MLWLVATSAAAPSAIGMIDEPAVLGSVACVQ